MFTILLLLTIGGLLNSDIADLTLGETASSFLSITNDLACFNYTHTEDQVKEGLEVFILSLSSTDPNVCLGRDTTLVRVPPNGGTANQ